MGLLDDIQKGLGFKDRDKDYYDRTAKSIGRQRGGAAEARYRDTTGLSSGGNIGSPGMPQRGGLLSGMRFGEYRDMNDMFDGGGPMARGGQYEGGGLLSFLGNLRNALVGRDMGDKVGYGAPIEATMKPKPRQNNEINFNNNRGFEPTANQIAAVAAVSEKPVQGRTNLGFPGYSAPGSLRVHELGSQVNETTQLPLENLQVPESNISNMRLQTYNSLMLTVPSDASSENFQKYADDILYDITRLPYNEWLRLQ